MAYFLGAWLVIESSSVIFPALFIPQDVHRFVIYLAIGLFPFAMVWAWFFDIGLGGVSRTEARGATPPARSASVAAIAVLPFEVLSDRSVDRYTAQALCAEIGNALTRVPELRVAPARHPAVVEEGDDARTLAGALDVQYLLTGTVRRKGAGLRIIAELADVANDRTLWSEAYDRPDGAPSADIEEEIASAVVGSFGGERLRAQLSSAREGRGDPGARELAHRARAYLLSFGRETVREAEVLAREAVALDRGSAIAHAVLGAVLAETVAGGISERIEADLAEAAEHVDEALRLAPQDPFVLKLAGSVGASRGDLEGAETLLRQAVRRTPFDFGAWGYLAGTLAARGDRRSLEQAVNILDRILEQAPRHPGQAYWLHHKANALAALGRFPEVVEHARRAIELQPGLVWAWYTLANALAEIGDEAAARAALDGAARANPELDFDEYAGIATRICGDELAARARLGGLQRLASRA